MSTTPPMLTDPLGVIDRSFSEDSALEDFVPRHDRGAELLRQTLEQNPSFIQQVPLLNNTQLQNIPPGTLVRYRGMVQDMWNPEFFIGAFKENSPQGQVWRCGKYRDAVQMEGGEESIDQATVTLMERHQYYCVPVPGETLWIQQRSYPQIPQDVATALESPGQRKRSSMDEDEPNCGIEQGAEQGGEDAGSMELDFPASNSDEPKRSKPQLENSAKCSPNTNHRAELHFPVREQPGCACVVKVYNNDLSPLKICDVGDFVGILSFEPEQAAFAEPENDTMLEDEKLAIPPASLVPRLHCIRFEKLEPANPLLAGVAPHATIPININEVRSSMLSTLSNALGGDMLAAEYVLLQLLSSVHARMPGYVLGKFCLNLCCKGFDWSALRSLLEELLPRVVQVPMTIQELCQEPFSPAKDYTTNRLRSGLFQLTLGTHLMIDESALQPGQLDATGLMNIKALGLLLTQQQVEYDFQYHQTMQDVDLPAIITSEGKTLLPADCTVPVQSKWMANPRVAPPLAPNIAEQLRGYLAYARQMEYSVPQTVSQVIQQEFVSARQHDSSSMTPETLNHRLQLARLVALSFGKAELSIDMWNYTQALEEKREARIPIP